MQQPCGFGRYRKASCLRDEALPYLAQIPTTPFLQVSARFPRARNTPRHAQTRIACRPPSGKSPPIHSQALKPCAIPPAACSAASTSSCISSLWHCLGRVPGRGCHGSVPHLFIHGGLHSASASSSLVVGLPGLPAGSRADASCEATACRRQADTGYPRPHALALRGSRHQRAGTHTDLNPPRNAYGR